MTDEMPQYHVVLGPDGPIGSLPPGVTWASGTRTVTLRSDEPGDLRVTGTGDGDGDAVRDGDGAGSAHHAGYGVGDAVRYGAGDGDAVRGGLGNGSASRYGSGDGDATRAGKGDGDATHGDSGGGTAVHDGSGDGTAVNVIAFAGDGDAMAAAAQAAIGRVGNSPQVHRCGRTIKSNRRKCILVRGHGGHCRSK